MESGGEMCSLVDDSVPVRGIGKSGRIWKTHQKQRSSSVRKGKGFSTAWAKKAEAKKQLKILKSFSNEIIEEKKKKKIEKRIRREENDKRRQENARKAEVVQVVSSKWRN